MNSLKGGVSLKKIYNKIISLFVLFTLLLGYGGSVVSHVSAESTGGLQDTIGVDKTAKRTPGCRTFEVNLNITGELQQAPVDVVLVLDRSGSMNFVETPNSPTRLDYGKLAAINFAERVLGPNGIPGSRVSVVSFSGPAYATGVRNNPQRHYGQ